MSSLLSVDQNQFTHHHNPNDKSSILVNKFNLERAKIHNIPIPYSNYSPYGRNNLIKNLENSISKMLNPKKYLINESVISIIVNPSPSAVANKESIPNYQLEVMLNKKNDNSYEQFKFPKVIENTLQVNQTPRITKDNVVSKDSQAFYQREAKIVKYSALNINYQSKQTSPSASRQEMRKLSVDPNKNPIKLQNLKNNTQVTKRREPKGESLTSIQYSQCEQNNKSKSPIAIQKKQLSKEIRNKGHKLLNNTDIILDKYQKNKNIDNLSNQKIQNVKPKQQRNTDLYGMNNPQEAEYMEINYLDPPDKQRKYLEPIKPKRLSTDKISISNNKRVDLVNEQDETINYQRLISLEKPGKGRVNRFNLLMVAIDKVQYIQQNLHHDEQIGELKQMMKQYTKQKMKFQKMQQTGEKQKKQVSFLI